MPGKQPVRPTRTVTFPFSDIQGSTRLLSAIGTERYQRVLDEDAIALALSEAV